MGPTGTSPAPGEPPAVLPSALGAQSETARAHRGACRGPLEGLEGAGKMEANMERMFHNPNLRTVILQGESYLKKRRKKKTVNRLLRDCVFCVHTSHSSRPGGTQISVLVQCEGGIN